MGKLKYVKCEITMEYDNGVPTGTAAALDELFAANELVIEKKTKKGVKEVDLKPSVELLDVKINGDNLMINMRLPAGTQTNYNPTLFLDALKKAYNTSFEIKKVMRTAIICENNEIFL